MHVTGGWGSPHSACNKLNAEEIVSWYRLDIV